MCGIAGVIGKCRSDLVGSLINSIRHRGPDQLSPVVSMDDYKAATCRLSIVDIKNNLQPIIDQENEICLSFNGEIYNHQSIRDHLKNRGYKFETNGDVEVLLKAYREWGIEFIYELEGMYAIAVYDKRIETLFLLRDRLGIKPIYFCSNGDFTAYASEIKAFFAAGIASDEIDDAYLFFRSIFDFGPPDRTLFSDIRPVEPGTYLRISAGAVTRVQYYNLMSPPAGGRDSNEAASFDFRPEINDLLTQAVSKMIPTEVPWGILASGGIDSSVIAAIAKNNLGLEPLLITLGDETESEDFRQAKEIAVFLKTPFKAVRLETPNVLKLLPHYLLAMEEFDSLSIYLYIISSQIGPQVKVVLSGQGADELFCGYPFYRDFDSLLQRYERKFAMLEINASRDNREQVMEILASLRSTGGMANLYSFFLKEQLVGFQLLPLDKCTMAHGLEVRVPYLDYKFVDYILSIPLERKMNGPIEKELLRESFADSVLPNLKRRKQFSGESTLPNLFQNIRHLADTLITDIFWANHRYRDHFNDKLEMLCFDILVYSLTKNKGTVPDAFDVRELFVTHNPWQCGNDRKL